MNTYKRSIEMDSISCMCWCIRHYCRFYHDRGLSWY